METANLARFSSALDLDRLENPGTWNHSRHCGPSTDNLIREQFSNLIILKNIIEEKGYLPHRYGFIEGLFLEKLNGQTKFVVVQGTHRLSVLIYLKYSDVLVRQHPRMLRTIRESESKDWRLVKSGVFTEEDALAYFNAYFNLTGYETAKEYKISKV